MSDILWQEIATLRERVKQLEMNQELMTRGVEQRLAAHDQALLDRGGVMMPGQVQSAVNGRQEAPA